MILTQMSAHGDSTRQYCGFGTSESDLIVEATKWATKKYKDRPRTILVGVSLGGSASWLATEKEPDLFDAIATEGAFTHLDDVSDNFFKRRVPGGHIVFWPVKLFASKIAGVDPSKVNPLEAAQKWKGKPALVVHCEADYLMEASYADEFTNAAGAQLWTIPKAEHANGCVTAGQEYFERLIALATSESLK
jgi:pimeloyl-ACP methyl ester carboxylesterase